MREILFKAKRIDNDEWVEGDILHAKHHEIVIISDYEDKAYRCDGTTICQCTGLNDKNGQKIWENDIVRYTFDYPSVIATENGLKERISSVFWSEWRASWSVYADERKGKGMNNDLFNYVRNGNTVEIIGNVFDNPELLEVE